MCILEFLCSPAGSLPLQVLQGELSAFVASAWVQLPHPDDGSPYYYNQVCAGGEREWLRTCFYENVC